MTLALPASRIADPTDAPSLAWGILGPGRIAGDFAASLRTHTAQRLAAVGSRSAGRAEEFARTHGIPSVHESYEALVADPLVDVVYIATPHPFHAECALLAIEHGKHVVVEKPFAMNADEAEQVADAATRRGVFAMEAMWPRFLPATDVVRQVLAEGLIGEPRAFLADLGEHFAPDPAHRLYNPALGGGALLDLGVYLVSYASFVLGAPDEIAAVGSFTGTRVDAQETIVLRGPGDRHAHLYTTLEARTPTTAVITGTRGVLEIAAPFYLSPRLTLRLHAESASGETAFPQRTPQDGLCFEAAEAARAIAAGRTESPLMPIAETVRIARTLDGVRESLIN